MTKFRDIHRRMDRIGGGGDDRPVPHVLRVGMNETQAEAHARFAAEFPHRKPSHRVLVVPVKPRTEGEHELWAERFRENQLALRDNARRERIAIVKADQPAEAPRSSFPKGGIVAPPRGRSFKPWIRNS